TRPSRRHALPATARRAKPPAYVRLVKCLKPVLGNQLMAVRGHGRKRTKANLRKRAVHVTLSHATLKLALKKHCFRNGPIIRACFVARHMRVFFRKMANNRTFSAPRGTTILSDE